MVSNLLPTRRIGQDNVSALGFGAMTIGNIAYGKGGYSQEERFKVLDKLLELGCTNWDTADVYGDSEELIGNWFKRTGNRDKFGLTTELPNGTPEYIKQASAKSLQRLGVETIDLYYVHRIDRKTPIEVTMKALVELVEAGKIRYIGLSEPSPDTLRRAHKVHPIAAIQVEYSPFMLDVEKKGHLLDTARELGVTVIAYSPLGRGLLTGQVTSHNDISDDDFRKNIPKYSEANFPKILSLVSKIKDIGDLHNATPGQISLAFMLAQGDDIIPIPGTRTVKYAEENVGALKVTLSTEEIKAIRDAVAASDISGDNFPPGYMEMSYGDTPELS
ncbi:aldo/keto reductase family protein [Ceratobasidium sp. AG-Ba]|nr:aldo/keto reductase family protein [Ceratobasidium sp. AG-Ba]QRW01887.1 aldo/keto reductase family protein [Ceratobasidium sp. AG-Ba]